MYPCGKTTGTPKRIARLLLASLFVGLLLAASLSLATGAQDRFHLSTSAIATRIMAVGDSNTLGIGSPGGYRVVLYQTLTGRGFAFHMVGSQSDGPPELPEKWHEGYSGYTIDQLKNIPISGRLALNPPDVVLLLIGTNDASGLMDMPNAPARLGSLLDVILAASSAPRVIVSTIPPFNLDWTAGNQAIRDFNAALPAVVNARSRVTLVDLWPQINVATDMADGVHLNANGAAKLGALFADAVSLGAPPPPPPPPPPVSTTLSLTTSKNPSMINETVTVSGQLLDASDAAVVGRTVQLEWSGDQATWYLEGQIGTFAPTSSSGRFSGTMAFRGTGAHTEYIRARFAGDSTYGASLTSVVAQSVVPPTGPPTNPSPPQVASTVTGTAGANGWFVSPVTITLTVTGGTSPTILDRIDDTPWTNYGGPFQIPEGRHRVQYQGVDANGSFGPSKEETFEIDTTAPIFAANAGDLVLAPEAPLTWTGFDALSGIAGYAVRVDGGPFRMIGLQAQVDGPWAAGSHSVIVNAYDGAGNMATTTIPFRVLAGAPPAQPAPAPAPAPSTLPMASLLAVFAIGLAGAGGLLYGLVRRGRTAARKGRKPERKNSTSRHRSFDGVDNDDTESLL